MRSVSMSLLVLALAASLPASAQQPGLETDDQKTLYALGLAVSQRLLPFNLTEEELKFVQAGLADGVLQRDPQVELQTFGPKINELQRDRAASIASVEKGAGAKFCEQAAQEPGALTLESGMVYREIEPGGGDTPGPTDRVRLHYHGTLRDGTVFDSSVDRGQPAEFALNGVIPCFSEGLQKMKVGGKSKLTCPSSVAYGDGGRPPVIQPGAALVFEVELLAVVKPPAPPSP